MEGVSVNPEGESRHGQVRAKLTRKERENEAKIEEKVDGKAPRNEGAVVQKRRRLCERIIEPEPGGSRRNKFRAERDQHPTKAHVLV